MYWQHQLEFYLVTIIIYVIVSYFLLNILCVKILKIYFEECHIISRNLTQFRWSCILIAVNNIRNILMFPREMVKNDFTVIQIFDFVTSAVFYYDYQYGNHRRIFFWNYYAFTRKQMESKNCNNSSFYALSICHIIGAHFNLIVCYLYL